MRSDFGAWYRTSVQIGQAKPWQGRFSGQNPRQIRRRRLCEPSKPINGTRCRSRRRRRAIGNTAYASYLPNGEANATGVEPSTLSRFPMTVFTFSANLLECGRFGTEPSAGSTRFGELSAAPRANHSPLVVTGERLHLISTAVRL
jgi:hypothetical protein